VELKHRDRIVQVKIVYYGPAVGGKTTNLQMLHSAAQGRHRGEFISVSSTQDRTILFDLLPLKGLGFHQFEIRFQLAAVPGQAVFAATRRLVMRGADAVVFVANSAADRLQENVASVREMAEHMIANGLDPATIPLVFQHNKRDLPKKVSIEELENALNYREAPSLPAVAIRGEGVLETFAAILEQTMEHLMGRYPSLALPPGETVQDWTRETLDKVFGRASIAREEEPVPAAPTRDRRIIRVRVPRAREVAPSADESRGASSPATPAAPTEGATPATVAQGAKELASGSRVALVETYAQASLELGQALERTRGELELARRRLDELEHTLRAIEAVEDGSSPEQALRQALHRVVVGGGARGATLLGVGPERTFLFVTAVGLDRDPILQLSDGDGVLRQRFASFRKPTLVDPAGEPDVARAVAPLDPPVKAVTAVPVRSALGLHGLVLLYYGRTDPLPSPAVLAHVGNMARVLAAWFSVRRAAAVGARAGELRRTLPQIESAARAALVLVNEAIRNPRVAGSSLEKVARTLDAMATLTGELAGNPSPKALTPRQGR
jgi:signal recognition particle receptor subunit beta